MPDSDNRKAKFLELIQTDHFARIEELKERLDDGGFWDDELMSGAEDVFKKSYIRRMVKQIKDSSGWPVVASIEIVQPDGEKVRAYMPETLFEMEHYQQCVVYWRDAAHHAIEMTNGYATRANDRFGAQMPLPFPETD